MDDAARQSLLVLLERVLTGQASDEDIRRLREARQSGLLVFTFGQGNQIQISGNVVGQSEEIQAQHSIGFIDKPGGPVQQTYYITIPATVKERIIPLELPARPEKFTGREDELVRLLKIVRPGEIVTICGPGGMGKTALAIELMWRLTEDGSRTPEQFPDGLIFYSFYGKPDHRQALSYIANWYGVEAKPTPEDGARRALAGKQALLVLDGTEDADHLSAVLDTRGRCGILITTQSQKDVHGESEDLKPLEAGEAVRLLQDWAGIMAAESVIAEKICSQVDNLPLAIIIAGSYMRANQITGGEYLAWLEEKLLEALHQGKHRMESVTVTLARSMQAMSHAGKETLALVGCLAPESFRRAPIAAALSTEDHQIGRSLGELVGYGLLIREADRYQVRHRLVHAYAGEKLELPEGSLEKLRHYYASMIGKEQEAGGEGFTRLSTERAHILAFLKRLAKEGIWEGIQETAWPFEDYLDRQGYWIERMQVCQICIETAQKRGDRGGESAWLNNLGLAYADLGQPRRAIEFYQQALAIAREIGDRRGEGIRLGNLGNAYADLGQPRRAIEYYEQALAISREIGDRRGEGIRLGNLGNAYADLGQPRRAIEYYEQALAIAREIGDRRGEGDPPGQPGECLRRPGAAAAGDRVLRAGAGHLPGRSATGAGKGLTWATWGTAYADLGEARRAIEFYEQALAICPGDRRPPRGRG